MYYVDWKPNPRKVRTTLKREEQMEVTDSKALTEFIESEFLQVVSFMQAEVLNSATRAITYSIRIFAPAADAFQDIGTSGRDLIETSHQRQFHGQLFDGMSERLVGYALEQYKRIPPDARRINVGFEALVNVFDGVISQEHGLDEEEGQRLHRQHMDSMIDGQFELEAISPEEMVSRMISDFLKQNPALENASEDETVERMMEALERGEYKMEIPSMKVKTVQKKKFAAHDNADKLVDEALSSAAKKVRAKR